jgi:phage shock protein A
MPLLERVTTLIRANLNDLIEKAENPEKLLKQLLLDMENQFMQVKTQVAMAIADQHLLEKKQKESLNSQREWLRKAELAMLKNEEPLARTALERSLAYENAAMNFSQQVEEQSHQVHTLRDAMQRLEQKMTETKLKADLLIAQHRRSKLAQQAGMAPLQEFRNEALFERAKTKVDQAESVAAGQLQAGTIGALRQLEAMDKADQVERLLAELKQRTTRALGPASNGD